MFYPVPIRPPAASHSSSVATSRARTDAYSAGAPCGVQPSMQHGPKLPEYSPKYGRRLCVEYFCAYVASWFTASQKTTGKNKAS